MSTDNRFGLTGHPLPKDAHGKTFFDKSPGLRAARQQLSATSLDEPGLGVLTGEPGVGKTAAIRNLCWRAAEARSTSSSTSATPPSRRSTCIARSPSSSACKPSHRRAQLWTDIKKALVHLVDERCTAPVVVIDEAQHLGDTFLLDLSGFLNFAFDSRDLLTLWLVGLPPLARRLAHAAARRLATRIAADVHLEPFDKDTFAAAVEHALKAGRRHPEVLADPALELLFRASRGFLRVAAKTPPLRAPHRPRQGPALRRRACRRGSGRGDSHADLATTRPRGGRAADSRRRDRRRAGAAARASSTRRYPRPPRRAGRRRRPRRALVGRKARRATRPRRRLSTRRDGRHRRRDLLNPGGRYEVIISAIEASPVPQPICRRQCGTDRLELRGTGHALARTRPTGDITLESVHVPIVWRIAFTLLDNPRGDVPEAVEFVK